MRHVIFLFFIVLTFNSGLFAQQSQEPWSSSQLIEPATLASKINLNQTGNLLILSVGPDAVIKGSVGIGSAKEQANVKKLKSYLKNISKDKEVIIYCGCCPFDKCPNIRPAFKTLNDMGFKNAKLLNLSKNIKANWIDKNYPTSD
ncbi:MAG: rhodanese-like domain-containing protein [Bacteroidetes bacterium]|nr:rhodanese-like domain-containing protein [Bacteroidota bacterium]MBS1540497.1 rhodanese-like domain-containing protein [Bacteroidota bacterium]